MTAVNQVLPETSPENALPPAETGTLARLYGETLLKWPDDLYIPPDALEIFLDAFEGPLDLLLYLIRRQNFNILDIPMAQLTAQYLAYVEQIRQRKLELAAEYLLMAAALVEIKSRMLLPTVKNAEEEDSEDPRAELVRRLLEYERIKQAAGKLENLPLLGKDFFIPHIPLPKDTAPRWPDVFPEDLRQAFADVIRRSKLTRRHTVSKQELSVREHMSAILKHLQAGGFTEFYDLFDPSKGVAVIVVHFLALLELARESLIEITQAKPFDPIYIRLCATQ